jgi:hypothetical protein
MSAKRDRAPGLLSTGTFWLGMGFILAAPMMNLAYSRLFKARISGNGSERPPEELAFLYNLGGPTGVAMLLIATGVAILILGQMRQVLRRPRSPDASDQSTSGPGQMALQTRKYFS